MNDSFLNSLSRMVIVCGILAALTQAVEAEIPWQRSPENVLHAARQSGKPILVFVTTDWCHYCKRMKHETWNDAQVETVVSRNFVTLKLDGDRDQEVVEKLGLQGYPATLIYTPDGHFLAKHGGYMPADKTMQWLGHVLRR